MELFTLYDIILFIVIGCFGGFLAGLLGVGGGIVYGPAILILLHTWNVPDNVLFPLSFGTSLFIIIFTSLSALIKYQAAKTVIWRAVILMSLFSIIGALAGVSITVNTPAGVLQRLYGLVLFYAAYRILKELKTGTEKEPVSGIGYFAVCGLIMGLISSTFGIGGGIVGVPLMMLVLHFPIRKIAGTSSGIIVFTSIAGVIRYITICSPGTVLPEGSLGFINFYIALPFIAGAVFLAPVGAYLNGKMETKYLKIVFSVFLIVMGIKLIFF